MKVQMLWTIRAVDELPGSDGFNRGRATRMGTIESHCDSSASEKERMGV
jgi:hypothetical protein